MNIYLSKVLKSAHLDEFLDGKLYMRTVSYYRSVYEKSDKHEGVLRYFPKGHKVKIDYGNDFEESVDFTTRTNTDIIDISPDLDKIPIMCLGILNPYRG